MTSVWSEVDPALTSYDACTWCSILMVVVASGFTAFPLGAYTHEERRAFRGSDSRLNFSGGVDAAVARYGVSIVSPAPYTQAGLQAALATPGKAYAVAGQLANFPAGHPIRRHDPGFTGFHAVCVIPKGNGEVLWLDPLAPMNYAGDTIPAAWVTDTFAITNYPNDARYLPTMVNDVNLKGTPIAPGNWRTTLTAEAGLTEDPTAATYTNLRVLPAGTPFTVDWQVDGPRELLGTYRWYGGWVTNPAQFGYIISANCGPLTDAGYTQADIDAAVAAALAGVPQPPPAPPVSADIATARANLALLTVDLNDIATARNAITAARTRAVAHKNAAKTALGG